MTGSSTSRRFTRRSFLGVGLKAGLVALAAPAAARRALAGVDVPETARCWRAMGTLLEVRIPDLPEADAIEAIRKVRARVEEMEAAMTLFREESPLVAFNRSAPGTEVHVPADLARGMAVARDAMRRYPDEFTCFGGPVNAHLRRMEASGVDGAADLPRMYDLCRAASRLLRLPYSEISVSEETRVVSRGTPAVTVDLGAVGKGMAVDDALAILAAAGSRSALINFGGSIGVLGAPPHDDRGWLVGLAHPRREGELWATLRLREGHLATSGDYERGGYVPQGVGRLKPHHLLDPQVYYPAHGVASATVWRPTGTEADVLSTVQFLAGSESILTRQRDPEATGAATLLVSEIDGVLDQRALGGFGESCGGMSGLRRLA